MRGHLKLLHHRRAGISELLYFSGLIPLIAYNGALKRAHRNIFLQTLCKTTCETRAGSSTNWWCWSMPYYPLHCILYPIIGRKKCLRDIFLSQLGNLLYEGASCKHTPLVPLLLTSARNAESNNSLHNGGFSQPIQFDHFHLLLGTKLIHQMH